MIIDDNMTAVERAEDDETWRSGWGRWGTEDISDEDERRHEAWLAACRAHRGRAPAGA